MRVVHTEAALVNAVQTTKAEAGAAFGNPEVYMEKFLQNPRHVEIQIMADQYKNADEDPVLAYRMYYVEDKKRFAAWTNRPIPEFMK